MANKKLLIEINVKEKKAISSISNVKKSIDTLKSSVDSASRSQDVLNQKLKEGATNAGLAGAIVTEFGRTISDLPYGIRAVGNNISQLASLTGLFFANAARTGLTVKEAFADLKSQILGPVGIVTGLQIFIALLQSQKVIDFIESIGGLNGKLKILSDLTKGASENASSLIGNFKIYTGIITNVNESEEQRRIALKRLNDEYPDFNSNILTEAENTNEATKAIDEYTKALKKKAMSQAAEDEFRKISGEIVRIELEKEISLTEERNKFLEDSNRAIIKQELSTGEAIMVSQEEKAKAYVDAVSDINNAAEEEIKSEQKKLDYLLTLIDVYTEDTKKKKEERNRVFKAGDLDFEKERQQSLQRAVSIGIENEKRLAVIEFQGKRDRARIKVAEFEEDQKRRLDEFKKRTKDKDEILDAEKRHNESIINAKKELSSYIIQLDEEEKTTLTKIQNDYDKEILRLAYEKQVKDAEVADIEANIPKVFAENAIRARMSQYEFEIKLQKAIVNAHKEGTIERAEAEKRLVDLQKQYAQEKVDFDKQRFDQIKQMYNDFSASVGFISETIKNNEIRNAGESEEAREAAMKKAWKVEKALKISRVIMDTYEQGWLAYGSQLVIGDPSSPLRAQIAQALTIAKGVAQIAAISSTQFNSKSLGGAGGKSGVQVEAPDFNVVGASPESQLAQTVAGQQAKPIKAFVVGKEITSQQELDRNILTTAGLGD